jgi:hypothetical protein
MSTEAMKLALERAAPTAKGYVIVPDDAFKVIKEALAKQEQGEPDSLREFKKDMLRREAVDTTPQPKQEQGEPVAWMFQHEDTGLTDFVDAQQVEWGFEKNNPRWQKIGPLYTTPQQRSEPSGKPAAWVGLTDDDKVLIKHDANFNQFITVGEYADRVQQLTEARLKDKNNG